MNTIEELNYFQDPRTRGPAAETISVEIWSEDCGDHVSVELPTVWVVCPVCNGAGKHVNPSIDCGGLTAEDFHDDPDFAEAYFRGDYDQTCSHCSGRTTVRAPDLEQLTDEERKGYERALEEEAAYRAEVAAELRMGA